MAVVGPEDDPVRGRHLLSQLERIVRIQLVTRLLPAGGVLAECYVIAKVVGYEAERGDMCGGAFPRHGRSDGIDPHLDGVDRRCGWRTGRTQSSGIADRALHNGSERCDKLPLRGVNCWW